MDHRLLGRTGVRVSPLCLGTLNFGGGTDEPDAVRMVHAALDAGLNFVDTADVYHAGESERIVGKALAGRRDKVVLATKVHGRTGLGPNDQGNSRLHILRACDASLRRLGDRLHRSLPGPSAQPGDSRRRDARSPDRPRAGRQGPLHRLLDPSGMDGDGSARRE